MKHVTALVLFVSLLSLVSCYSVRIRNENGSPALDPFSNRDDYYRGMAVVEIDTVIRVNSTTKDFTYLITENDSCRSGKLNILEFRNTFGAVLLSAVTLGRKRKLKLKYVCEKPQN